MRFVVVSSVWLNNGRFFCVYVGSDTWRLWRQQNGGRKRGYKSEMEGVSIVKDDRFKVVMAYLAKVRLETC